MLKYIIALSLSLAVASPTAAGLPKGLRDDFRLVDIPGYEDVVLKSLFFDPAPKDSNKNPLIIFISSW